jgi:hypothetical protein
MDSYLVSRLSIGQDAAGLLVLSLPPPPSVGSVGLEGTVRGRCRRMPR